MSSKNLRSHLCNLAAYVSFGLPNIAGMSCTVICTKSQMETAISFLRLSGYNVGAVCFWNEDCAFFSFKDTVKANKYAARYNTRGIHHSQLMDAAMGTAVCVYADGFSLNPLKENRHRLSKIRTELWKKGLVSFNMFNEQMTLFNIPFSLFPQDYYTMYAEKLEETYSCFANDEEKDMYARYIKCKLTGNSGFMPRTPRPPYDNPYAAIRSGDILVDAGVSPNIKVISRFSQAVGERGKVFGFEPILRHANTAAEKIQATQLKNVEIIPSGLWSSNCTKQFEVDEAGSSTISEGHQKDISRPVEECRLTTLDSFLEEYNIPHVDVIKMDIEGAEVEALRGAEQTIVKQKPTLLICLYHTPQHLYEIPLYIKKLYIGYRFYLNAHAWHPTEFVLCAVNEGR